MGLEYVKPHTDVGSGVFVVDRRMYLTEDDRLVEEGHPDGRWLFCTPGMSIPREQAERYGLLERAKSSSEPEAEAPAEEPKARTPAANKARGRTANK